jgi:hypothetical protein
MHVDRSLGELSVNDLAANEQLALLALDTGVVEPPQRRPRGSRSFELPGGIFAAMGAAYVAFLAEMTAAFGDGHGMPLLLVVCAVYLAMYLGTPALFAAVDPPRTRRLGWAELKRRGLDTACGRMSADAVAGQVLVVPLCVAAFGLAILVIKSWL